MGRTQPEVVQKFTIRLTNSELRRVTDLALKLRESKTQALRRIIDFFRQGQISTKARLTLPFNDEVATNIFMCGVFKDQIRFLDTNCKRQMITRGKFIRSLIHRLPEIDEITLSLLASPGDSEK